MPVLGLAFAFRLGRQLARPTQARLKIIVCIRGHSRHGGHTPRQWLPTVANNAKVLRETLSVLLLFRNCDLSILFFFVTSFFSYCVKLAKPCVFNGIIGRPVTFEIAVDPTDIMLFTSSFHDRHYID